MNYVVESVEALRSRGCAKRDGKQRRIENDWIGAITLRKPRGGLNRAQRDEYRKDGNEDGPWARGHESPGQEDQAQDADEFAEVRHIVS